MKIIIAGNLGYIGPSLTEQLRNSFPDAELIGFDIGYFANNLSHADYLPEVKLDRQVFGDIRKFPEELLTDVDAVIDLAAISNDPMGKQYEEITMDVNYRAAVRLAEMCKRNGVKNFVFASSCSVYGTAGNGPKNEGDELNPLTAYARSKAAAEKDLQPLADESFTVTCFRFATACGFTSRVRLDLVLNDFVAGGMINKCIDILSDGTPWRPLIDTKDMARALEWGVVRKPETGGQFLVINAGSNDWNFQIRALAEAVAAQMPSVGVNVNQDAEPDKRSYQISFDLYEQLAPDYQPMYDLKQTICEMRNHLESMHFSDSNFRDSTYIRLKSLKGLRDAGLLNGNLEWI